jgi:hypothetical protein
MVFVYDLERGKRVHKLPVAQHSEEEFVSDPKVPALVLSRDGGVAWTVLQYHDPGAQERRVGAADACGRRKLDDDPGIDPESLRLAGRTVTWTAGGAERSAHLRSSTAC